MHQRLSYKKLKQKHKLAFLTMIIEKAEFKSSTDSYKMVSLGGKYCICNNWTNISSKYHQFLNVCVLLFWFLTDATTKSRQAQSKEAMPITNADRY